MLLLPGHVVALLGIILQLAWCQQQPRPLSSHTSASLVQNDRVYILGGSRTGIAVISTALQTLGYKKIIPGAIPISSADQASNQRTFSVVSIVSGIDEQSIMSPGAKFILPVEDDNIPQIEYSNGEGFGGASAYQNYARSAQDVFVQLDREESLLVFQITKNSHRVGTDWPMLCHFLGLGYSTVERYRLKQFPMGHKGAWTL
ncbi:hypothetical protein V493_06043 [Pseudogymnoascus sp. VKM F-4281 (FW-2241)]|nr:hypothetical protein V493_06043 [Pseudogymnoascus sp. VKM F-4281 (FW-2241)]